MGAHTTVLLNEAVDALMARPDGNYIDGTFGRGGHSRRILQGLNAEGRLLGVDRDASAVTHASAEFNDPRFTMRRAAFSELPNLVRDMDWWQQVDGLLLDLGVSSPQLDQGERGFSFMRPGPLDMRMDDRQSLSAADWLAEASADDISRVLFDFGEERHARRIARAIVARREQGEPLQTTQALAELVAEAVPGYERGQHPATRSFQGIRIFINDELGELQRVLSGALDWLRIGGRLVVISFHSLEDRLVKRFFRDQARGQQLPRRLPVPGDTAQGVRLKLLSSAVRASPAEVSANPRARSAVMRVAERVA